MSEPIQPGYVKRNAVTEVADQLKAMNAQRGSPAGRMSGAPVEAISGTRVQTAGMLAGPRELTLEEQAELDEKARGIGILPKDELDSAPENRMTAREIMEAALPVDTPAQRSVRELAGAFSSQFIESPRLPDFTKIQGIDLIRNVAFVDTFEIPLSEEFVQEVKEVVLNLAVDLVTKKIAEALVTLIPPKESEELKSTEEGPKNEQGAPPKKVQRKRKGNSSPVQE